MPNHDYPPAVYAFLERVQELDPWLWDAFEDELYGDAHDVVVNAFTVCLADELVAYGYVSESDKPVTPDWLEITPAGERALALNRLRHPPPADAPRTLGTPKAGSAFASTPTGRAVVAELQAVADSPEWRALAAELGTALKQGRHDWEAQYGTAYPESVEDLQRLLVRAGVDANRVLAGDIALADASSVVLGHLERVQDMRAVSGPPASPPPADSPTHSADFTSVDWFGTSYTFTKGNQAETVRALWEEYKRGGGSLGQGTIREKLNAADSFTLRKLFRHRKADGTYQKHPAWGTMIRQTSKGVYGLVPPPAKKL